MKVTFVHGLALMGLWFLLSGKWDPFHISLGVLSVLFVCWFNRRIHDIPAETNSIPEWESIRLLQLIRFIPWLAWQMLVANIQVLLIVLNPRMPIDPALLSFRMRYTNTAAKIILGHSITLTPGTLSIKIDGDQILVHALTHQAFGSLIDGTLPAKVAGLFHHHTPDVISDFQVIRIGER